MQARQPKTATGKVPETKQPTIDQKTLDRLRAMRKAEPPPPQPTQPQPAPQVAQQQPPSPPQPLPQNQQSLVEAPKPAPPAPAPSAPDFNTGSATPGDAIRQAARAAASGPPVFGGSSGTSNAPNGGPGSAGGASIISDTMGVNFDPYLRRIVYDTERAWWPIIPEVARPPLNKQGRVLVRFKIFKDGSVKNMTLEGPSGDVSLDRAAWGGILGASPFPQLPKEFKGDFIELRFYFLYNVKPGNE
jgi:TonB family protein